MNSATQYAFLTHNHQYSVVETIGPETAKKYLKHNSNNRPLRKTHVEALARDMKRGVFFLSHQGIAFDVNGQLADGQHRLAAIIDSGCPVQMLVTRNVPEDTYKVVDVGAKRSIADALRASRRHIETATYITRILIGRGRTTTDQVEIVYGKVGQFIEKLIDYCGTSTRGVSSAPIKAAAVLSMYLNPSPQNIDYVLNTYRDLVLFQVDSIPSSGASFLRQSATGTIKRKTADLFCRALVVFDISKKDISRIQISDANSTIADLRERLKDLASLLC
jgi:hypothetical protein